MSSDAPIRLGTGPNSWGVDFADAPDNAPWEQVLDEIAMAGYTLTELGPVGYMPEDTSRLSDELGRRGLAVAGSFLFQPLHESAAAERVLDFARRTAQLISGVGGRFMVVIDEVSPPRAATAGRPDAAPRLDTGRQRQFVDTIKRVCGVAAEEFDLRPVLHNHAGSYLEFPDEIELVLEQTERDLLGLCLDTGHAAYAGFDPVAFFRDHHNEVDYFHLKDIDGGVHRHALEHRLDFWSAISAGIFCPLDRGVVDFPDLAGALRRDGFDGYATIEQDRDAGSGTPFEDAIASREYLERLGLAKAMSKGTR